MKKIVLVLFAMVILIAGPCLAFDGYDGHAGQIPLCQSNKTGVLRFAPMKDIDSTTSVNYEPYCNTRFFYGTTTPTETLIWINIQGIQGPQGEKGDKGDQGLQGTQGLQGDKGDQGLQGIQGIQGPQGVQGVKGDKGDKGDQGIQGIKGDKGDQGIQGIQGLKGDQGLQGIQGVQGPEGPPGVAEGISMAAYGTWNQHLPDTTQTGPTSSITRNSTGQYAITFPAFTSIPTCVMAVHIEGCESTHCDIRPQTESSAMVYCFCWTGNTYYDQSFTFLCVEY